MATVLFAWELGGGAGHCGILVPLIEGLVTQGHSVYFAACDLRTASQLKGSIGVRLLPVPVHSPRIAPIRLPRSFAQILINTGFGEQSGLFARAQGWRNLIELVRPDLLVCEHAPTALLASRGTSIRRAVVGTGFTLPPDNTPWPDLRPWLPQAAKEIAADEESVVGHANRVLRHFGQRPLERMAQLYVDVDAAFLVSFQELDHYADRKAADYLGSWSIPGGNAPNWPDGPGPRAFSYVKSYGTKWQIQSLLSVLKEMHLTSLVYVGRGDIKRLRQFEGPRLRIVTERIDIQRLAAEADVAILNGTAGTTAEFLRRGVPVLEVPVVLEQTILSRRVEKMRAGLLVSPQRSELLAVRLGSLLHESCYRQSAQEFAAKYAGWDPQHRVAHVVEKLDELARN